jgi:hypothetical protein
MYLLSVAKAKEESPDVTDDRRWAETMICGHLRHLWMVPAAGRVFRFFCNVQ